MEFPWSLKYRIGAEINRGMEPVMSLQRVADELGITPSNAYTETVLALGALVLGVRHRLGIPLDAKVSETPEIAGPELWSIYL